MRRGTGSSRISGYPYICNMLDSTYLIKQSLQIEIFIHKSEHFCTGVKVAYT